MEKFWAGLEETSEARRAFLVIVTGKREREIRMSTNTNTNSSEAIERNEAYESFSADR